MTTQYKEQLHKQRAKELFCNILKPTSGNIINGRQQLGNQTMEYLAEMLQFNLCKKKQIKINYLRMVFMYIISSYAHGQQSISKSHKNKGRVGERNCKMKPKIRQVSSVSSEVDQNFLKIKNSKKKNSMDHLLKAHPDKSIIHTAKCFTLK